MSRADRTCYEVEVEGEVYLIPHEVKAEEGMASYLGRCVHCGGAFERENVGERP